MSGPEIQWDQSWEQPDKMDDPTLLTAYSLTTRVLVSQQGSGDIEQIERTLNIIGNIRQEILKRMGAKS